MAGFDLPTRAMRSQIASAINVVVQLNRFEDGQRRLVSIHEITGMEGDVITMQEIFKFERTGIDTDGTVRGHFVATGIRPNFMDAFERRGIKLSQDIFNPTRRIA